MSIVKFLVGPGPAMTAALALSENYTAFAKDAIVISIPIPDRLWVCRELTAEPSDIFFDPARYLKVITNCACGEPTQFNDACLQMTIELRIINAEFAFRLIAIGLESSKVISLMYKYPAREKTIVFEGGKTCITINPGT